MPDSTEYEESATHASLAGPGHSDMVPNEEAHVDSPERGEQGTNGSFPGLERSDDAQKEKVSADTERSWGLKEDGMNGSSIEGGNDEAGYLRGLAAEVVNQEDLERRVARQV